MTQRMLPALDYRVLFRLVPTPVLVLDKEFTILDATDAYVGATHTSRDQIVGRNLFTVFPDNPEDPQATGVRNLRASLDRVVATGRADSMAVQKYDVRRPSSGGNVFEEKFWSPLNVPILTLTGDVCYVLHRVEDVTDFVRLKQREQKQSKANAELQARNERMEAEIYRRAQEIQHVNDELRQAAAKERAAAELADAERRRLVSIMSDYRRERAASTKKSEFLTNLSHELRTPLNGIIGFCELLADEKVGPLSDTQQEFLRDVLSSANHLLQLINDILDLSKIEAGEMELFPEWFLLAGVIAEVCAIVQPLARQSSITIECPPSTDPIEVCLDALRLRQVLCNLVANAVQYNRPGGSVRITATHDHDWVSIAVTDTGVGIAPDETERIFEEFRQLRPTRRGTGTGLGLAVTKRLVLRMGGSIHVESELGHGSRFTLHLPVVAPSSGKQS